MSPFRALPRAPLVVLCLSLLLLVDGLAAVPAHVATATDDPDEAVALPEDVSVYTCESGFDDIDSQLDMSLHGVTQLGSAALAVGYARRRDRVKFGQRVPVSLVNEAGDWRRIATRGPGNEDGLVAVASRPGANTWAVGWTTMKGRVMPLAMRWNGRDWRVDRPRPQGRLTSLFTDVTIAGDGRPLAVGYRMTGSGQREPIAARKVGPDWRYVPIRVGGRESVTFTAVAPDRRGGVWVVGHGGPGAEIRPMVYRRDDGRWTRMRTPRLAGEAALLDVVATSPGAAWAVGYHRHDGVSAPLALRWDGKRWRTAPAPAFASDDALLTAVSADPAGGVWVVGAAWHDERKSYEAVAAWWDGQAWNEYAGPAGGTVLYDVIGSLDEDGWAVGRSGDSARTTRVCTPLQSGVFGGSLPTPPARTASGGGEAVDTSAGPLEVVRNVRGAKARQAKNQKARRQAARARRGARSRIGTLPAARADRSLVARDVARQAGIYEQTGTYGGVVADFDGDGIDDLFIGRHGRTGRLLLNRDGVFVDHRLDLASVDRHGCTAADIDGSGLPDLYCAVGGKRGSGLKSNELWLDPGGPDPREVAVERGVSDPTGRGRLTAFLEATQQSDVGLVVTNSPTRVDGLPSVGRFFRTNGDGAMQARTRPGFAPHLGSLALDDADFDGDGREDLLLVTGGPQAPLQAGTRLYRNTRRGLVDVTRRTGIRSINAVDAELVDLNGDQKLDLVQLSPSRLRVSTLQRGRYRVVYERRLTHGRALAAGDVNGDGRDDLYILRSNGGRNYGDVMLVNRKGGREWWSLAIPQARSGSGDDAYAIDHDGNGLDDFVVLNGHNTRGPLQLIAFYDR